MFTSSRTMNRFYALALSVAWVVVSGCATNARIRKLVQDDPTLVYTAIQEDPERFMSVFQKANADARAMALQRKIDDEFRHPKAPRIDPDRAVLGNSTAPVTIVPYADFQCPYCKAGAERIEQLRRDYGDKIRFMFKHCPLDMHPMALPAARYFEAVALQGTEKAYRFHD